MNFIDLTELDLRFKKIEVGRVGSFCSCSKKKKKVNKKNNGV